MPRKVKSLIILSLIVLSTVITLSFRSPVKADVTILSTTPSEGYVGDSVQVTANTTTENGNYTILFDGTQVKNGTAEGTLVNASFPVPHAISGLHNVTVRADSSEAKANFTVLTKYAITNDAPAMPKLLQENSTIGISLNVTGGESSPVYSANVTVRTPANTTYWMNFSLASAGESGYYNASISYPSMGWTPSTPNTNFTGIYLISWLNGTQVVGATSFFLGLTNSTQFHRGDSVDIKAVDYPPDQNVTITVSGVGVTYSPSPFNATVDADGVVHTNWTIPSDVPIGVLRLSITPIPSSKSAANDTQVFEVPGFETEISTRNLADKPISDIFVKARDESTNINYTATSDSNGTATIMLENGTYFCEAFFRQVKVGETNITIVEEQQINFTCNITSMIVRVIDEQGFNIPFVSVELNFNYTTNLDVIENRTGQETNGTDITGIVQFDSLLTNITYIMNASRYGQVFNQNNNTVSNLPAVPYENITILCPAKRLPVKVIDTNDQPISNATVEAQELVGGLGYSNTTSSDGTAILQCTFGRYEIQTYVEGILLNETTLDLFDNQNETVIKCQLYGLTVSIKVVDYFGQPIPNAEVRLLREGLSARSSSTQSDGTATFGNVIGGNIQVAIYLSGQAQPCIERGFFVDSSTTAPIEIRIEKYVVLLGFLIETSLFATVMIVVVAVICILSIEAYRRKRGKPQKAEEVEQE